LEGARAAAKPKDGDKKSTKKKNTKKKKK